MSKRKGGYENLQFTDAELRALQAERNYLNCRAMMLHYARMAHAWHDAARQTRHHLPSGHAPAQLGTLKELLDVQHESDESDES